jgi:ribonuclease P/MRP protein subunit POP1
MSFVVLWICKVTDLALGCMSGDVLLRTALPHLISRYINGSRMLSTYAFADSAYPYRALGLITVLWKPYTPADDKVERVPPVPGAVKRGGAANASRRIANANDKARKANEVQASSDQSTGKGKGKADVALKPTEPTETSVRTCWVRAHPACFELVFDAIREASGHVLEARKAKGNENEEMQIADLREKVLAFELLGPKSTQVLRGALDPVRTEQRAELRQASATPLADYALVYLTCERSFGPR